MDFQCLITPSRTYDGALVCLLWRSDPSPLTTAKVSKPWNKSYLINSAFKPAVTSFTFSLLLHLAALMRSASSPKGSCAACVLLSSLTGDLLNWRSIQGKPTIANYISEMHKEWALLLSFLKHVWMLLEITGRVMISRVRAAAENAVRSRNHVYVLVWLNVSHLLIHWTLECLIEISRGDRNAVFFLYSMWFDCIFGQIQFSHAFWVFLSLVHEFICFLYGFFLNLRHWKRFFLLLNLPKLDTSVCPSCKIIFHIPPLEDGNVSPTK